MFSVFQAIDMLRADEINELAFVIANIQLHVLLRR